LQNTAECNTATSPSQAADATPAAYNSTEEKSKRIIMFCDLRDSTDILQNFERGIYHDNSCDPDQQFTYGHFLFDLHKTSFEYLYLGHKNTHTEIYGDGLMALFPEDNTKYILENIYRLTQRMRSYNDSTVTSMNRPAINLGFGITVGEISMVHYQLDNRNHPIGMGVHEAARIEGMSRHYHARVLISDSFFNNIKEYIDDDPRFSYRFIDRVRLKSFRTAINLYELLVDNDPKFEQKINSVDAFSEAYHHYCHAEWAEAEKLFSRIHHSYKLDNALIMADRCITMAQSTLPDDWDGTWDLQHK